MALDLHLIANPHYYDYLHDIRFSVDGKTCEFNDGGGQVLNYELTGTYIKDNEKKCFKFNLFEEGKDGKMVTFEAPFVVEDGIFILKNEVVWKQDEDTWPCSIFTQRYVFKEDPHELFAAHASEKTVDELEAKVNSNLYTQVSGINKDHLYIYYNWATCIRKNMNELTAEERNSVKW